ncbi:MAG TPA: hypothetical protein VLJ37_04740, partial [bacterium]|nr:hypothetical protein [bacterium]
LTYATESGKLFGRYGRKLVHFGEKCTIDVDDPQYPDGPFGLRHKTGNVNEWVERNWGRRKWDQYGLRGGCYDDGGMYLRVAWRGHPFPDICHKGFGFRVGAPVPRDSML